jgi:hypothetical protein
LGVLVYGHAAKTAKTPRPKGGATVSDIVDRANRRRARTAQYLRRVETLASELAKFSPDFVGDFLQRMIADAGPHDEIRRHIAEFADEVRQAIPEHREPDTASGAAAGEFGHGLVTRERSRPATDKDRGGGRRAKSAGMYVERNFTLIAGGKA